VTWYLAIEVLQEPADVLGLDSSGRVQLSFNVIATKRASTTWLTDLIAVLVAAGVGVEAATLFNSSLATIPNGAGPFLSVRSTGGAPPEGTHNDGPTAYQRPGAQVLVRGADFQATNAMAYAAYNALAAVRNRDIP
jgi:hypothetical protein